MTRVRLLGFALALLTASLEIASADDSPVYDYYMKITQLEGHTRWAERVKKWNEDAKEDKSMLVDVERVQKWFRNLHATEEIPRQKPSLTVRLFVGDVFEFVGPVNRPQPSGAAGPYNIDALIISTNADAEWRKGEIPINNPTIQKVLFHKLKPDLSIPGRAAFDAIDSVMKDINFLEAPTKAIATKPIDGFSPRLFCFVAADRKDGGTYADEEFLTEVLTETKLATGICSALDLAADNGTKIVVLPFIGSSRPDLRTKLSEGQEGYLNKHELKNEIIKRLHVSLGGIVKGIVKHKMSRPDSSIKEIGIVLHFEDVLRIASGSNGWDTDNGVPGLKTRLASDSGLAKAVDKAIAWDEVLRSGVKVGKELEDELEKYWCISRAELEHSFKLENAK